MKSLLFSAILVFLASAGDAEAAPVVAAVQVVAAWVAGLSAFSIAVLQIAIGTAMSLIAKAKMRRAQRDAGGIQTDVTLTGGTNSETFILGYYATAGTWVCPPLTHGERNKYLTYAIDLAGLPGHTLEEVFINGEKLVLDGAIQHGVTVSSTQESFKGLVSLTYFDGSQTSAPQMMLDNYGSHPDFPWSSDMVGRDRCFVIMEFETDNEVFSGLPQARFALRGIPIFDPRDGGVRQTDNLGLLSHAVLRGVQFPDGSRWGGEAGLSDLPISAWASAMNEADRLIDTADGGSEAQFRGGFEVKIAEVEPAEVLERFMDACTGDLAEEGGIWHVRIGAPPLPSAFLTDADLIVDAPMALQPFASLSETQNGLTLKFPNPASAWEVTESERILRADLEAEDEGRSLMGDLSLSACPYALQVQRVGQAYIEDSRRDVVHSVTLPPDFAHLPPLSVVAWTSDHNQYDAKQFSIEKKIVHAHDLLSAVELREVNPSDHSWSTEDELPVPFGITIFTDPGAYVLSELDVRPIKIYDSEGQARHAAISVSNIPDLPGVEWRLRDSSGLRVADGVAMDVGDSFVISQGVLPAQTYFVGFRVAGGGNVDWSQWYGVETDDVRIGPSLLDDAVWTAITQRGQDAVAPLLENFTVNYETEASLLTRDLETASLESLEAMLVVYETLEGFNNRLSYATQDLQARIVEGEEALATAKTALGARIDNSTALLEQEAIARATADEALAESVTALEAEIEDPETGLQATASGLTGVASRVTQTEQGLDAVSQQASSTSAIVSELDGAVSAQAATLSQHSSRISENEGAVSAQASSITSLTATVGDHTASISEAMTAIAGIGAEYVLRVSEGGTVVGMVIAAEAGDDGAVEGTIGFAADVFQIVSPNGGSGATPFAFYSTPRVVDGILLPAGLYIENAFIGRGAIGRAQIADVIESDNYAEVGGKPTAGLKLDFRQGTIYGAGKFISANQVLASGSFTVEGTFGNGHRWEAVNTGIIVGVNDVWNASDHSLKFHAALLGFGSAANVADGVNAWWGARAEEVYDARWFGLNAGDSTELWQRDPPPAQLVVPDFSTGTTQRVWMDIVLRLKGIASITNPVIGWKVKQVR